MTSQLSLDINQNLGNHDYSFIPLVLDNSPGPSPAGNNGFNRFDHHEIPPRPAYDRKMSNASSQYDPDRDRGVRPHIATQDRTYDLQNERSSLEKPETDSKNSLLMRNEAQIARDYLRSEEGPAINVEAESPNFKLNEVPRERKKSISTLIQSLEVEHQKSRSTSPIRTLQNLPPRGDSYRAHTSRTDSQGSMTSSRIKAYESSAASAASTTRTYAASGTSSTSSATIESPETPKDTKYTNSNFTTPVPAARPSPPRRPSTAQGSTFSDSPSENSGGYKSPIGGFGDEVSRAFDSTGGLLNRLSGSAKHSRSLSEATKQSPKWPRSPSSGTHLPNFQDITSPLSPAAGLDDIPSLRIELRKSQQKVIELENKLNVGGWNIVLWWMVLTWLGDGGCKIVGTRHS